MNSDIEIAIKILNEGGVIIFPTDTAYGIGCRIDDERAIGRLFKIRRRPKNQAVPVLVDTVKMAQDYLLPISKEVIEKLIEPYWPGALTIILDCNRVKVPSLVRGGGKTLGVRIPNHRVARAIIRGVGVPILGPSANFSEEKTPYEFKDLNQDLIKEVDFVIGGECPLANVSTIIDCTKKPWKVLREGAIKIQNLKFKMQNFNSKFKIKTLLLIDTADSKEVKVGLRINGQEEWVRKKIDFQKAQAVLPLIEKILRKKKIRLKDLNRIEVNTHLGSFTGVRVGLSVSKSLGFALKIPVKRVIY